jgi:hypothetical protein
MGAEFKETAAPCQAEAGGWGRRFGFLDCREKQVYKSLVMRIAPFERV